ncbi:uncharacterized protein METZ01_LOCUS113774, partial [marine metagenome]
VIDLRLLRRDPAGVKAAIARRGEDTGSLDRVLEVDARQREAAESRDRVRNEIKTISREVGGLHKEGKADQASDLQERSRALGVEEVALADESDVLLAEIADILLRVPNVPADQCPDGADQSDNVVVRVEGYDESGYSDHQRVPHWEVGEELGILDVERGA